MAQYHQLADRLLLGDFDREACLAAMRGEAIPHALGHPLHQKCLVRGIRYHSGFASELYDLLPLFTRALNARMIMDGVIPTTLIHKPYCIWHPVTASEAAYRQLARQHPDMKYQVGRACAVAGYTALYQELDLLPDVHIAEEAREGNRLDIYQLIVSQPIRYSIMNDYDRKVDDTALAPAYLNGNTAVRWMLDVKQGIGDSTDFDVERNRHKHLLATGHQNLTFNITEDMNVDDHETGKEHQLSTRLEISLLSRPLPLDLPTVQKDMLILMAAYMGDIDRYTRLRRPKMLGYENICCIRGIYHNTFFAVWWSKQEPDWEMSAAINARMIMNNMLAGAPYKHVPYLIWWPTVARESTYRELARLQPSMTHQIVHACIFAGYQNLYDELLPQIWPDEALLIEAENQSNTHFRETLFSYREESEGDPSRAWTTQIRTVMRAMLPTVGKYLTPTTFGFSWAGAYNGRYCSADNVELAACLPDAWMIPPDATTHLYRELDYAEWPYDSRAGEG